MRRIYRKMRVALLSFCVLTAVLSTGCSAEETGQSEISEEVYQLGNQEIQIDLSDRFECTKQSASEIVLDGKVGEIKMEYLGEGIYSESFPKSEQECAALYEDVIGGTSYQIEEFQSYDNEGLYYATIRYDLENEIRYLIASGKFGADYGCQIFAVLNTGNRETAEEIQNAIYNVKVFSE